MTENRPEGAGEPRPDPERSWSAAEIEELLPGYVFGALEPDEMLAVDAFIAAHPSWQQRLNGLMETAASLAHAAPRATLPSRAKEKLMRRVQADAPVTPAPTQRSLPFGTRTAKSERPPMRGLRPIPRLPEQPVSTAPSWFEVFWRSFAFAGAAAAILLLAFVTWQLMGSVRQLNSQLATTQSELEQVRSENQQLHQANATLTEQMQGQTAQLALMLNPQQQIVLAGTEEAPFASGTFYRRANTGLLVLHGLEPLSADQTYQLWYLPPDGAPIPADLITADNPQSQTVAVNIAASHENLVGVGISIEPAGGSSTPTTILLLGTETTPSA